MPTPLVEFLQVLSQDAIAVVPAWQPDAAFQTQSARGRQVDPALKQLLEQLHTAAAMEAPYVAPDLSLNAAVWSAQVLHWSCWSLLNRLEEHVTLPADLAKAAPDGETAAEHWSVDLSFRFMPSIVRQCRRLAYQDALLVTLEELLSNWPLSAIGSGFAPAPNRWDVLWEHPCLWMMVRDRVLARGDQQLAGDPRIRTLIEEAVQ